MGEHVLRCVAVGVIIGSLYTVATDGTDTEVWKSLTVGFLGFLWHLFMPWGGPRQ